MRPAPNEAFGIFREVEGDGPSVLMQVVFGRAEADRAAALFNHFNTGYTYHANWIDWAVDDD